MHLSSIVKPPARQITVVFSWDKICHNYRTEAFFLQNISVHILMCRCSHLESFFFSNEISKVQMFLPGAANVMALVRSVQLAFAMVRLIECLG